MFQKIRRQHRVGGAGLRTLESVQGLRRAHYPALPERASDTLDASAVPEIGVG